MTEAILQSHGGDFQLQLHWKREIPDSCVELPWELFQEIVLQPLQPDQYVPGELNSVPLLPLQKAFELILNMWNAYISH